MPSSDSGGTDRTLSAPVVSLISFIAAESLSLLGNQIAAVTIPLLVLQYTGSPLLTGVAGAGAILPIVLAALIGGRMIDRFGAWKSSVIADVLSCCSVLALPLAFTYAGPLSPLVLFLLVFLGALFDPTGVAARQTLVPSVVARAGVPLHTVNSWRGSLENGADFLGPIIGVALVGLAGVVATFYINAATFLLCAVLFAATVPRSGGAVSSEPQQATPLPGLRFILRHAPLRGLAIAGMVSSLVILPFLGLLLPVLTTQVFASPTLLGVCLSVFGLAATVGAASFSLLSRRFSRSAIYYSGLVVNGIAVGLCALASSPYEVVGATALAGLLLGAGNPLQQTILHEETPEHIAGQVFTSLTALHFATGPVGLLAAGVLTEYAGVQAALLAAGAFMVLTALTGRYLLPLESTAGVSAAEV